MRSWGAALSFAGAVITIIGFVLHGNHGIPFQDPADGMKPGAADGSARLETFLAIGVAQTVAGLFVFLAGCIERAVVAKWTMLGNLALCAIAIPFYVANPWIAPLMNPHHGVNWMFVLNAVLAPIALPFAIGRFVILKRASMQRAR